MRKVRQPKGTVILFAIFLILAMLAFGGLAIDVAGLMTVRSELYRATDAAALAGAGNLAFDDTVFPAARAAAVSYAASNPTHFGPVTLNANAANAANGDVVLGIWDGTNFTPSLDGTQVNATLCRASRNMPTSFLRLLGLTSVPMSAQSIATSNPPNTAPGCVLPIGVTTCQFSNGGAFTSQGCGTSVTFTTSSGHITGTTSGTNTAAWVNLVGGNANGPYLIDAINAAANGTCVANPVAGQPVEANNGMQNNVMDAFAAAFVTAYNASSTHTIKDPDGNTVYSGKGWEVYVPLIQTTCPPTTINETYTIQTFSKFVFTQVIHHKACTVSNPADGNTSTICANPSDPSYPQEAIFGYFDCAKLDSTPTKIPVPRAALATKLHLVR